VNERQLLPAGLHRRYGSLNKLIAAPLPAAAIRLVASAMQLKAVASCYRLLTNENDSLRVSGGGGWGRGGRACETAATDEGRLAFGGIGLNVRQSILSRCIVVELVHSDFILLRPSPYRKETWWRRRQIAAFFQLRAGPALFSC
jgi:hypothetical protein